MSAVLSRSSIDSRSYWSRADAPARVEFLAALAALKVGERLRLADVTRGRGLPPPQEQGGDTARAADAPPLVEYTGTALRAGMVDPETREVEFSFSSETPCERWWGIEVLGHGPGECDLSWMASGRAPFLSDHDTCAQIGVITRAYPDKSKKQNRAVARFGCSDDAAEEMADAQAGVRVNISVGYQVNELELVKKDGDTPTYRVTDWMPLENSLVSIPLDMSIGLGRSVESGSTPRGNPAPTIQVQPRKEQPVTEKTEPLTGEAQFRANVAVIGRLAAEYKDFIKPGDESRALADGADPQKFNELIMQRMKSGTTDATTLAGLGASQKEKREYSFLRAIAAQIQGSRVDNSFEREVSTELSKLYGREAEGVFVPTDVMFAGLNGRRAGEKRTFVVGTSAESGNLVQTNVAADLWTDVLRPALVLADMGIAVLPGLRNNIAIPRKTVAGTLAALSEIATASQTNPTTALPTLTPKRVSAFSYPSKQAIIQGEIPVEAMIRQDLLDGAAVLLENYGINGLGSSSQPRGIRLVSGIGSVAAGTNGAAISWAITTSLEAAVANANANSTSRAGYVTNTRVRNVAKNTSKTSLLFIWDGTDTPLNNYRVGVTNNVPNTLVKGSSGSVCSSLIFSSDWSMFVLGLFGGLDVTVDPYSLAETGQVKIVLNQFYDWQCRQPGAFSTCDDLLAG